MPFALLIILSLKIRSEEAKKNNRILIQKIMQENLEDREPNEETIRAIKDVKKGEVKTYKSSKEMIASLKKASEE
jgi:ribosomal protein S8